VIDVIARSRQVLNKNIEDVAGALRVLQIRISDTANNAVQRIGPSLGPIAYEIRGGGV